MSIMVIIFKNKNHKNTTHDAEAYSLTSSPKALCL